QSEEGIPPRVERRAEADGLANQVGSLRDRRAAQQAGIGAAADGDPVGARPALGEEPFGGGDEVIERVLAFIALSGSVPPLTKFGATPQRRNGEEEALLHQDG